MKTPYPKLFQDKALFKDVMDDLVNEDVLTHFDMFPKKIGKKISDWRFDLYATEQFSKQIAANNKVSNETSTSPQDADLPSLSLLENTP